MKTSDLFPVCQQSSVLIDIFVQAIDSGHITLADRNKLMEVILEQPLSDEEQDLVDRLFYARRQGWLTIVN